MDWKTIIELALTIIVAVAMIWVIPWLKQRLGSEQLANVWKYVCIAVRAAEQIYKAIPKSGEQKKAYVVQWLENQGIEVDEAMIEAAVKQLTD